MQTTTSDIKIYTLICHFADDAMISKLRCVFKVCKENAVKNHLQKFALPDSYKDHKTIENLKYEQRLIQVDKVTFCPLILGTGGACQSALTAIQRLASRISEVKMILSDLIIHQNKTYLRALAYLQPLPPWRLINAPAFRHRSFH